VVQIHFRIELIGKNEIRLPLHYNHLIQGFIYKTIDKELADFLHNNGYGQHRKFKLFCFSNLLGKPIIHGNHIIFNKHMHLEISSPNEKICESFANSILKKTVRLGENLLEVGSIQIDRQDVLDNKIIIQTLSPITAYSTLIRPSGSKYTCYFQPGEEDFSRIVVENLRKKHRAYTGLDSPEETVSIKPLTQPRLHIVKYKDFIIKGYTGKLSLEGPRSLLQMAVDAGLGSKNSQGFGCVELVKS
jgi:CRISPR-associated endoribonuclease Cas6